MAVTDGDRFAQQVAGESASGGPKRVATDDNGAVKVRIDLPSADPHVVGALYYIAATGVVMRSAG